MRGIPYYFGLKPQISLIKGYQIPKKRYKTGTKLVQMAEKRYKSGTKVVHLGQKVVQKRYTSEICARIVPAVERWYDRVCGDTIFKTGTKEVQNWYTF